MIKSQFLKIKRRLEENSVDTLICIVNVVPSLVGFSLHKENVSCFSRFLLYHFKFLQAFGDNTILWYNRADLIMRWRTIKACFKLFLNNELIFSLAPFWIIYIGMQIYVYGAGNLVYQLYYAQGFEDYVKSYVNVSILVITANSSYWFLMKRPLLSQVIKQIKKNDALAKCSPMFHKKYEKLMYSIKIIVLIFYGLNYVNASSIYLPRRVDVNYDFSMTHCVGMEPLTQFPKRQVCQAILGWLEISNMFTAFNFQTLLIVFIAHTSAMYQILTDEILTFDHPDADNAFVREKLPSIVGRHVLTLDIIIRLKKLYSVPIGINFGANAFCISLFVFLPLEEWFAFFPVIVYCSWVFFLYCFLCQRLINSAELFEKAVYACGWEKFDVKIQKTIYVMLIQAQKEVKVLAADIVPVNISTFATTVQFMYKLVTVVKF